MIETSLQYETYFLVHQGKYIFSLAGKFEISRHSRPMRTPLEGVNEGLIVVDHSSIRSTEVLIYTNPGLSSGQRDVNEKSMESLHYTMMSIPLKPSCSTHNFLYFTKERFGTDNK